MSLLGHLDTWLLVSFFSPLLHSPNNQKRMKKENIQMLIAQETS